MRLGFDEQLLYCCACIYLDFSILFNCVIRWPVLCHYGVQAWVEAGEQGLALLLSHRSSPTHPPLPFCLSLFHFVCLYFCCFTLSASNMHTVHTNANLIQYDTYLSNMILFSKCRFLNNYRSGYFPCASGCLILLVVFAQRYCCHLLLYHLFQNNVFYCFYCSFLLILPTYSGS